MVSNTGYTGFFKISLYEEHPKESILPKLLYTKLDCYDRFGFLSNDFYNSIRYNRYALKPSTNYSFKDVCLRRANELSKYDKIFLLFSGGIDTLTILSSLLNICSPSKIHLLSKVNSLENADVLVPFLNKNNINISFFNDSDRMCTRNTVIKKLINDTSSYIIVNGEGGDQINHSFLSCGDRVKIDAFSPYRDYLYKVLHFKNDNIEFVDNWLSNFPFNPKTIHDFGWIINFAINITHYEFLHCFLMPSITPDKHCAFFCNQEFTDWGINNYDFISSHNPKIEKQYKVPFKSVISTIFGDTFDLYGKVNSLKYTIDTQYLEYKYTKTDGKRLLC